MYWGCFCCRRGRVHVRVSGGGGAPVWFRCDTSRIVIVRRQTLVVRSFFIFASTGVAACFYKTREISCMHTYVGTPVILYDVLVLCRGMDGGALIQIIFTTKNVVHTLALM